MMFLSKCKRGKITITNMKVRWMGAWCVCRERERERERERREEKRREKREK